MPLPDYPPEWWDVSFGITSGFREGYQCGHRDGHRTGWQAGLEAGALRDETFIRSLADEIRRRDLDDEQMDTSRVRQWIKTLIESIDAKARRDAFGQRVRQDREHRQTYPQTQPRRAA
ncbi:hypothetical protein HGI16_12185 [Brevibacterium casei]|uniref:hypothetical protein n=1 Tax=Brevibacterium casei TaxID=33889 RepID=UPI00186B867D|nr:hypothetical protein [Brevibacterium casei]MBE4695457.1 hypothetical protein [Brevibacterium casei]MBY3578579.1 hypothetical protein [Brevibacterium casei]